jgi:hypothetical protein
MKLTETAKAVGTVRNKQTKVKRWLLTVQTVGKKVGKPGILQAVAAFRLRIPKKGITNSMESSPS